MANALQTVWQNTGLGKFALGGALGYGAIKGFEYAALNPLLERAGIKQPSYVPPPAMSSYEQMMLGNQEKLGFFNSRSPLLGYQAPTQGLLEKRALNDMAMKQRAQEQAYQLAAMRIQRQGDPLAMQQLLNQRDNYAAMQNTIGNVSANMAASNGAMGMNTSIGYSQTPQVALPQQQAYPNGSLGYFGAGGGRGSGRSRRGRNAYGIDTSMEPIPGMPVTQEMREEMYISPEQYGQFSGRGGRIARGYESQKYGSMDNAVPYGADAYAMGGDVYTGQSMGRRRRARG